MSTTDGEMRWASDIPEDSKPIRRHFDGKEWVTTEDTEPEYVGHLDARYSPPSPIANPGPVKMVGSAADIQVVFDRVKEIVLLKDHDYGRAWAKRGWRSQLERVLLKADRLDTMLRTSTSVPEQEKILETVHDMIALLAFMGLNVNDDNEWGKP